MDGWLSYATMKEKILANLYTDSAFMLRANNSYRSLFWRLIESLELLSVLTQCHQHCNKLDRANSVKMGMSRQSNNDDWGSASRLPTDSRIPKSSSIPSRLEAESVQKNEKPSILQKAIQNRGIILININFYYIEAAMVSSKIPVSSSSATIASFINQTPSRIPVIHYPSRSIHTPNNKNIYSEERPNTLPLRSRSIQSRPIIVAKVKNVQMNSMSPVEAGEQLRVLRFFFA